MEIRSLEIKIEHKYQQCDKMLSTFMKITRVSKLKNKIINYSPFFQESPTVNKLLCELKCPAISFVFVEMTPFGAVKPYILHSSPSLTILTGP